MTGSNYEASISANILCDNYLISFDVKLWMVFLVATFFSFWPFGGTGLELCPWSMGVSRPSAFASDLRAVQRAHNFNLVWPRGWFFNLLASGVFCSIFPFGNISEHLIILWNFYFFFGAELEFEVECIVCSWALIRVACRVLTKNGHIIYKSAENFQTENYWCRSSCCK